MLGSGDFTPVPDCHAPYQAELPYSLSHLGGEHAQYRACGCCFSGRHDLSDVRGAACFNAGMTMKTKGRTRGGAAMQKVSAYEQHVAACR